MIELDTEFDGSGVLSALGAVGPCGDWKNISTGFDMKRASIFSYNIE
jgi:hypothetical protein